MAIKAGRIITQGNNVLIERLQTAGVNNLNINAEKIKETGNDLAVATVFDTPDLSFTLDSYDMSVATEALLAGEDYSSLSGGEVFKFTEAQPIDITQPYKSASLTSFDTVAGAVIPYLTLDSMEYSFQVNQNAQQTATLSGDSIYLSDGVPYAETFGYSAGGTYSFSNGAAIPTKEQGDTIHAYSVTILWSDGSFERLFLSAGDYTDTASGFTVSGPVATRLSSDTSAMIRATYVSKANIVAFPQSVHTDATILPAAIKSYGVDVYVSDGASTPTWHRWPGLQSASVTWSVTAEDNDELGNPHSVSRDFDTPDVSGQVVFRPATPQSFIEWVRRITDTPNTEAANALGTTPIPTEFHIRTKDTGQRLKTIYMPDSRYTLPGPQAQVDQKHDLTMPFNSDTGALEIYNGIGPSGI